MGSTVVWNIQCGARNQPTSAGPESITAFLQGSKTEVHKDAYFWGIM